VQLADRELLDELRTKPKKGSLFQPMQDSKGFWFSDAKRIKARIWDKG